MWRECGESVENSCIECEDIEATVWRECGESVERVWVQCGENV